MGNNKTRFVVAELDAASSSQEEVCVQTGTLQRLTNVQRVEAQADRIDSILGVNNPEQVKAKVDLGVNKSQRVESQIDKNSNVHVIRARQDEALTNMENIFAINRPQPLEALGVMDDILGMNQPKGVEALADTDNAVDVNRPKRVETLNDPDSMLGGNRPLKALKSLGDLITENSVKYPSSHLTSSLRAPSTRMVIVMLICFLRMHFDMEIVCLMSTCLD